jgi:hypothetical protein
MAGRLFVVRAEKMPRAVASIAGDAKNLVGAKLNH